MHNSNSPWSELKLFHKIDTNNDAPTNSSCFQYLDSVFSQHIIYCTSAFIYACASSTSHLFISPFFKFPKVCILLPPHHNNACHLPSCSLNNSSKKFTPLCFTASLSITSVHPCPSLRFFSKYLFSHLKILT